MRISIVVAVAENWVIGRDGNLPWHLSSDLKRFKDLTTRRTVIVAVIVGRKTHESIVRKIGGSLPGRKTIVVTRQREYRAKGCVIVNSWAAAMSAVKGEDEVFVIGGAEIYRMALPYADQIYLTRVHAEPDGDTFFPGFDEGEWSLVYRDHRWRDERNEFDYTFETWKRGGNTD